MIPNVSSPSDQAIVDKVIEHGQEHVFRFFDKISEEQKQVLLNQLRSIDFTLLDFLIEKQIRNDSSDNIPELKPAPMIELARSEDEIQRDKRAIAIGEKFLRHGKVAAFLVAGGQGSRLGFEGPKGCYPISPIKNKTIFQLHAEKLLSLQHYYNQIFPLYIMTSEANHEQTKAFFKENDFFGLTEVHFFKQGLMPAVDKDGKLILEERHKLFMNPNGHGGSIKALHDSGALSDMKKKGIQTIFYFQVDNILINMLDPRFIGYHMMYEAQMSSKVLKKAYPEEKVGVIGLIDGKTGVIEYSVLPEHLKYAKDENGDLKFNAGSIAIHMMNVDFLEGLNENRSPLPYYKAFKAIPNVNEYGEKVVPDEPNAYKFEMLVFDALQKTNSSVTLEVKREDEFAPVKNKDGKDSPKTARELMSDYYKDWLRYAAIPVSQDSVVEISPLFAVNREEFRQKMQNYKLPLQYDQEIYLV